MPGQVVQQIIDMFCPDGEADLPGLMPCSSNSRALNWEWVVVAGWITRDFTSATLASNENICKLSINVCASFTPPRTSNVKIEPPPFGKYFP